MGSFLASLCCAEVSHLLLGHEQPAEAVCALYLWPPCALKAKGKVKHVDAPAGKVPIQLPVSVTFPVSVLGIK